MDISKRLKEVRKTKNISVYKLSQLSGVSETHIRDLERGDKNPSLDTLFRMVTPLGISLSELLNETDDVSYLNKKEKILIECFRNLSEDKADALIAFLKTL
ncbi:MAG: helix-turn-helix transcriptional regulator [Ruminiclostridium sp.]|nr:helix-turn-helix transcriptional regulator [Ruminiclostridium sp.]